MKIRRWLALALLALPALVLAQSVVQDGQSTRGVQQSVLGGHLVGADSTQDANRGDGNGNQYTAEAYPDQTFLKFNPNILQATLFHTYSRISTGVLKGPQADSSAAVSMLGATRMALAIRYTLDDSTSAALLMVDIRAHYATNTDSTNTFNWREWGNRTDIFPTTASVIRDTVGSFLDVTANALTDTVNAVLGERPVWLNQTNPFRAKWIPLNLPKSGAQWGGGPYVSVRARVIRTYGANGVAYTGTNAPPTALQVDLVGWR